MSGFAVLQQLNSTAQTRESVFESFLQLVTEYKGLNLPTEYTVGGHCTAAKLDSPSSLHRGITRDKTTGSWLFAAGTLLDITGNLSHDPGLDALLRDYLENGKTALQRYDGHFALVIYNKPEESLSVISDPLGLFSIFYSSRGDQIFVSTSALAVARQTHSKPDRLTIECFLRTGRVHGNKTHWQDVKRVPPATAMKITPNKIEKFEYWAPTVDETIAQLSFDEALMQATNMLSRIFQRFLQREGMVWADLTGGFDTRLTTMLMAKAGIPFIAYTVGPADHPDVQIAKTISQEMNWEFRHMPLPNNWEREQCAWFETALLKGDARRHVLQLAGVLWGHHERATTSKVHVLGLGGENWRGTYWLSDIFNIGRTPVVNTDRVLDSRIFSNIPVSTLSRDWTRDVRRELKDCFEEVMSRYAEFPNTVKLDSLYIFFSHLTHSAAYLSAATGVMRSLIPLCFKESINFALSLNYKWKIPRHHRFVRTLLESESPRLANIITTSGGPAIPMRVTNVRKFRPLWKSLINQSARKVSRKFIGKSIAIWSEKSNYTDYPLPAWRKGWLNFVAEKNLLKPSDMLSGALYNADELQVLVSQAGTQDFKHEEFLGRVITVEMAMRAVGTSVE